MNIINKKKEDILITNINKETFQININENKQIDYISFTKVLASFSVVILHTN